MRQAGMIIWAVALAHHQPVLSAEQKIDCPKEVAQASLKLVDTPSGWTPYVASPLFLSSAGATAGPPEQRATLMGDSNWKKGKKDWSTTYNLEGGDFPSGKWMECRYGEFDQVSLSKRLDDQTKSCTVQISPGEKAGQQTIKITCK